MIGLADLSYATSEASCLFHKYLWAFAEFHVFNFLCVVSYSLIEQARIQNTFSSGQLDVEKLVELLITLNFLLNYWLDVLWMLFQNYFLLS